MEKVPEEPFERALFVWGKRNLYCKYHYVSTRELPYQILHQTLNHREIYHDPNAKVSFGRGEGEGKKHFALDVFPISRLSDFSW